MNLFEGWKLHGLVVWIYRVKKWKINGSGKLNMCALIEQENIHILYTKSTISLWVWGGYWQHMQYVEQQITSSRCAKLHPIAQGSTTAASVLFCCMCLLFDIPANTCFVTCHVIWVHAAATPKEHIHPTTIQCFSPLEATCTYYRLLPWFLESYTPPFVESALWVTSSNTT